MPSTNKTVNLALSQFVATDKPTWEGDYNTDMAKADAGYATLLGMINNLQNELNNAQAANSTAITAANTRITNLATATGHTGI